MRHDDPNLPHLRTIAAALGELREQIVFIGGAIAGLLVSDPAAEGVRPTHDVDAIIEAKRAQFHRIEAQVGTLGFVRDIDSAVICRWVHRDSGVVFDLMPVDVDVLGFTNRWYAYAVETAQPVGLPDGLTIRVATPVAFVATKLEAFADRGKHDIFSHDLEDILNIVDGRPELAAELGAAPQALRDVVHTEFGELLRNADFANALPGLITDADRTGIVMQRLREMAV